ncbi:MAG: ribosome biogenesis GTP-binding protein YihA/YsxC [Proteobacteria bacterium]|nr:ribosome biogenesis GTP-binding protein YihA/YsxC [Pseudomonadota bacterium]MCH9757479.1 ribosome biogenesis GTP-binding protein YihA/YsxC [Pseudomonadota bacterium]
MASNETPHSSSAVGINFSNPQFICSVGANTAPEDLYYVVFVGRSNAGKSSVINTLCGGRYARVAKAPGRTRLINLFRLGGNSSAATLADLPGYGYAAVSKQEQRSWAPRMLRFLQTADIRCLAVVVDCRRGIGQMDMQLLDLYAAREAPAIIILNKSDKLNQSQKYAAIAAVRDTINVPVFLFSALKKKGVAEVQGYISSCLLAAPTEPLQ